MNKNLKIIVLLLAFNISSFAIDINQIRNEVSVIEQKDISNNIIKSKANTSDAVVEVNKNANDINFDLPPKEDDNRIQKTAPINPANKELLYFTLLQKVENDRDKNALMASKPIKIDAWGLKPKDVNEEVNPLSKTTNNTTTNQEVISFKGICQFENTVNVSKELTVNIPCKLDNKILLLNITLKPNNTAYELNGVPNFLMFDEYNNSSYSKRIFLDPTSSSVKNNVGNSNNIATYFDSRKIEKLIGVTAKEMSSSLATGTNQSFQDFRNYQTKQDVRYDQNGNIIVTSDTQKPDLATNLAYSAVEGVFRVVEKGVEMMEVESLPALYQTVKGTIINVELYNKVETK